jgi:hypothetical protein
LFCDGEDFGHTAAELVDNHDGVLLCADAAELGFQEASPKKRGRRFRLPLEKLKSG